MLHQLDILLQTRCAVSGTVRNRQFDVTKSLLQVAFGKISGDINGNLLLCLASDQIVDRLSRRFADDAQRAISISLMISITAPLRP